MHELVGGDGRRRLLVNQEIVEFPIARPDDAAVGP
jgi:hypothetical protein